MITNKRSLLAVALLAVLSACGGGGSSSSSNVSSPAPSPSPEPVDEVIETVAISGSAVKGPLAFADVSVYLLDLNFANYKGQLLDSGSTDASAAVINLAIEDNVTGWLWVEFSVDENTIDLNSNTQPIYSRFVNLLRADYVLAGGELYATPLTTMAVDIALENAVNGAPYSGNGDAQIDSTELEAALSVAQSQLKSSFSISNDIDLYTAPPLLNSSTNSQDEQVKVVEYRQAIESVAAITEVLADGSDGALSAENVLVALTNDLNDGALDGEDAGESIAAYSVFEQPITTIVANIDITALTVPGTDVSISNIEDLIAQEVEQTNVDIDVNDLLNGDVTADISSFETLTDTDGDGVNNDLDFFPLDASETLDSDGDGVGDNADDFPNDASEIADSDNDGVGDNLDVFPQDVTEFEDTDEDGVGNNADLFPNDPLETADTDNDGVGDNSDAFPEDSTRTVLDVITVSLLIGENDTQLTIEEDVQGVVHSSSSEASCDYTAIESCQYGASSDITADTLTTDLSTTFSQDGFHQIETTEREGKLEVGVDRWLRRQNTAVMTFNNRMWVIAGYDGINDGVAVSEDPNSSAEGFDGFLAKDVWSSQDGNTWVKTTNDAAFGVRFHHAAVEFDNKMWVIGGSTYNQSTQLNDFLTDVWYSQDGENWVLATESAPFPARRDHALVVFDNKMWVIGGTATDFNHLNDVWYSENGVDWMQATDDAGFPEQGYPRVVNFNNKLMLIGGGGLYDGVWSSSNGVDWEQEENTNFPARNVYSVTVHDNKIWVVGGFNNGGYLNDVWVSEDGITYTEVPKADGHYINRRANPGLLSFDEKLWILGGRGSSRFGDVLSSEDGAAWFRHSFGAEELTQRVYGQLVSFNDSLLNLTGMTYQADNTVWQTKDGLSWSKLTDSPNFTERYNTQVIEFNDKLWLIGGLVKYDGETPLHAASDIWSSTDGINWTLENEDAGFGARAFHTVVEWNNKLWLLSGSNNRFEGEYADIWSSSDGVNWQQEVELAPYGARSESAIFVFDDKLWLMGGSTTFNRYEDVWVSENGIDWTEVAQTSNEVFRPRDIGVRLGFKAVGFNDKIYLISGKDSRSELSDVWSSTNGADWVKETDDMGMHGRIGFDLAIHDNKLWLHGGAWNESISLYQRDTWVTENGVDWRVALQKEVKLTSK